MNTTIDTSSLEKILREYCEPLYVKLLPPLQISEIHSYFAKWGIEDDTLLEIFLWKNGIPYDIDLPTYCFDYTGFGVVPPLSYIDQIFTLEKTDRSWKKSLFPLVASFGGDFLLYETDKNSDEYGQIFLYSPNLGYVDYQIGYFDSIDSMIDTLKDLFEKKIFIYNNREMSLEISDYEIRSKIAARHSPRSKYWTDM